MVILLAQVPLSVSALKVVDGEPSEGYVEISTATFRCASNHTSSLLDEMALRVKQTAKVGSFVC